MVIPLFMFFAFLALQAGHLGIGIAIVNYAASSVARQAVAENGYNQTDADAKFKSILFAGLSPLGVSRTIDQDVGPATNNIKVTTCAQIPAFPLVGALLNKWIHTSSSTQLDACAGANKWIGPVGLSGPPYHFILEGQAVARMNYNAKG